MSSKATATSAVDRPAPTRPSGSRGADLRAAVGILGGTFNPPHLGHLALARNAREELGLERVVLMPAHNAPHKRGRGEGDPGPERRLEMCRLAVGDEDRLAVCGLELERGGPSYTVDTLRAILASHPEAKLTFIVGADMARTLPGWREPDVLLELADLAVAEREDAGREDVLRALAPLRVAVGGDGDPERRPTGVSFLKMPMVTISSSLVRERVAAGRPVGELVAPAVAEYIAEHGLYRAGTGTGAGAEANVQAQAGATS